MEITTREIHTKFGNIMEYTLKNSSDVSVTLLNLGATVKEIKTPDKYGKIENITLTYKEDEDYFENTSYLGSTIGPIAGRVAGGVLNIDSRSYLLEKNDGENSLHSGKSGLTHKIWESSIIKERDRIEIIFYLKKISNEEGHPGNIDIKVFYSLNENNEFVIRYEGVSDKKTVLNLTNHLYFNLSGDTKRKVTSHQLKISSDFYYKNSMDHIISSKKSAVQGSEYDFSNISYIRKGIKYNNYYPFDIEHSRGDSEVIVFEKLSGRKVTITTDHRGVVLYSSGYPNFKMLNSNKKYEELDGLALEFQNSPIGEDNIFLEESLLEKGEIYSRVCTFKFEVEHDENWNTWEEEWVV